jgi:hypothetical protein
MCRPPPHRRINHQIVRGERGGALITRAAMPALSTKRVEQPFRNVLDLFSDFNPERMRSLRL